MEKTVFLAGIDDATGRGIATELLGRGWRVFAARLRGGESVQPRDQSEGKLTVLDMDVTSDDSVSRAAGTVRREAGRVDMLVCNIDAAPAGAQRKITDGQDYDALLGAYDFIAGGTIRVTDRFQSLLDAGEMKRICVVTSADGSINLSTEVDNYARAMSKASVNLMLSILFNCLHPRGYTFRLYCAGGEGEGEGAFAVEYFQRDRCLVAHEPDHSDENRLAMYGRLGREYPW